jgi:hypothetical protein
MKKLLLATAFVLAGCVIAHAQARMVIDPAVLDNRRIEEQSGDEPPLSGWVKSADVGCNDVDVCFVIDNYTDARKKGQCALFAIPIYDRPNGKIVGSLISESFDIKRDAQRDGFTHVKSDGIGDEIGDFSKCG